MSSCSRSFVFVRQESRVRVVFANKACSRTVRVPAFVRKIAHPWRRERCRFGLENCFSGVKRRFLPLHTLVDPLFLAAHHDFRLQARHIVGPWRSANTSMFAIVRSCSCSCSFVNLGSSSGCSRTRPVRQLFVFAFVRGLRWRTRNTGCAWNGDPGSGRGNRAFGAFGGGYFPQDRFA